MARPLRIDIADGWYHITARGQNRQRIYHEARDYADFLKRLEGMSERYGAQVHGYVEKGTNGYRKLAETRLTEGVKEKVWTKLKWGAILGGERFIRQMRSRAKVRRETQGRASLQRRVSWPVIVEAVENVKGETWAEFVDRYGDWGRNMAFWMARRHGGLTLKEIGQAVGDMDYSAVSEAIRTFEKKHLPTAKVKRAMKTVATNLSLET